MAEYVAAQRDTPVEGDNQPLAAGVEEEGAQSDGAAEIEGGVEIEAAEEETGITLAVNAVECPRGELERLRVAARRALHNLRVWVGFTRATTPRIRNISSSEAETAMTYFFENMFGGIKARIKEIVETTSCNNSVHESQQLAEDDDVPQVFRNVFKDIAALKSARLQSVVGILQANIALVRFSRHWEEIKTHVSDSMDAADKILVYMDLVRGKKFEGFVDYRRLARWVLLTEADITTETFDKFIHASYVPRATADVFGNGAILFCPNQLDQ
jgi:hypothetical protein